MQKVMMLVLVYSSVTEHSPSANSSSMFFVYFLILPLQQSWETVAFTTCI